MTVVAFKPIKRVGDAVGLQELGEVVGAFDGTAVLGSAEGQGDEGEAVGNRVEVEASPSFEFSDNSITMHPSIALAPQPPLHLS
jgi:hypothetical protein